MTERGDSLHVDGMIAAYWHPDAVEARRLAHEAQAALIIQGAGCPECYARRGSPCVGLSTAAYHFARGAAYARKG